MLFIVDTSGIIAAYDSDATEHESARQFLSAGTAIISPLVLDEVDHLLVARFGGRRKDRHIANLVIDDLTSDTDEDRYPIVEIDAGDIRRARAVIDEYAAPHLDLTDAVNVVLADRYLTDSILTLDRKDFRTVQPLTHGVDAFRVLPDDAE